MKDHEPKDSMSVPDKSRVSPVSVVTQIESAREARRTRARIEAEKKHKSSQSEQAPILDPVVIQVTLPGETYVKLVRLSEIMRQPHKQLLARIVTKFIDEFSRKIETRP